MKFDKQLVQVLCPYGKWQHPRGMQTVDEESARRMRRNMSFLNPFRQIPIYIGHPDDTPKQSPKKPVGKISKILQTHDGIAVVAHYDDPTREKILTKKISAMSPRWQMEKLDDGTFRPVRLLSVGLTNNPNIPTSGTIISTQPQISELKSVAGDLNAAAKRCAMSAKRAHKCVESAKAVAEEIKSASLSERIKLARATPDKRDVKKKSAREICKLARERSERTGEPYTKTFAALKRKIS